MTTALRAAATIVAGLCGVSQAQVHQGDIELRLNPSAQLQGVITTYAPAGPTRVFGTTLGTSFPDFTADPGFDCQPATFPTGYRIGFRIHGALAKWTGTSFNASIAERMSVEFAGVLSATSPIDTSVLTGFTLSVGSNGTWHRHLEYTLLSPASDGVYALALSLFSTSPAVAESEVFWILFNQNRPAVELQAAATWIEDNVISPPGCPADWDASGGVDGDDVIAFFADWDANNADFNGSGGTDGDDVIDFFAAWDSGC